MLIHVVIHYFSGWPADVLFYLDRRRAENDFWHWTGVPYQQYLTTPNILQETSYRGSRIDIVETDMPRSQIAFFSLFCQLRDFRKLCLHGDIGAAVASLEEYTGVSVADWTVDRDGHPARGSRIGAVTWSG